MKILDKNYWYRNYTIFTYSLVFLIVSLAFGVVSMCGQRFLGHDSFYYLSFAKDFAYKWPSTFGSTWPYGYPLLIALLIRANVLAYDASIIISMLSLLGCFALSFCMIPKEDRIRLHIWLIFISLSATPVCYWLLCSPSSDIIFSFFVLLSCFFMAKWNTKYAPFFTVGSILAAVSMRYIGVFLWVVLGIWVILDVSNIRKKGILPYAISAITIGSLVNIVLFLTNISKFGSISGYQRDAGIGLSDMPRQLSELGLAVLGLVPKVLQLASKIELLRVILGWLLFISIVVICVIAWKKNMLRFSRILALSILSYSIAIAFMRSMVKFDSISHGRFIFPIIFPLVIILCSFKGRWLKKAIVVISLLYLIGGILQLAHGFGLAVRGNIIEAKDYIKPILSKDTIVGVNEPAFHFSAYVQNKCVWIKDIEDLTVSRPDYLMIAAQKQKSDKWKYYHFDDEAINLSREIENKFSIQPIFRNQSSIIYKLRR